MKKLLSSIITLVMLFSLAACTDGAQGDPSRASSVASASSSASSSSSNDESSALPLSSTPSSRPTVSEEPPLIESARDYFETLTYTEFENGTHSSPMQTVFSTQRDTFMPWLFAQRLP